MKKPLHHYLKLIPPARREKMTEKQKRVVEGYSSLDKLKAVLRWKPRITAVGISVSKLAESLEPPKEQSRVSEWLIFTHEPEEENYLAVEAAIYRFETA